MSRDGPRSLNEAIELLLKLCRAVDRPILTGFGMWRVLFVGLALLAVALAWAAAGSAAAGTSIMTPI